jgi:hypothetical protein
MMDDYQHALRKSGLKTPEARSYTFRLRGHGQDVPAGTFMAVDEQKAFNKALKACKRFELPGWVLFCIETSTALPVVKLTGYRDSPTLEPAYKDKGRRVTKRV